jgi:FixJ family two-component response regulator
MAARIAIVDDDASARAALARLLKAFGVETVAFSSAREFLDSRTIKVQRAGAMAKMAAGSLADLVRMAQRLGIEGGRKI